MIAAWYITRLETNIRKNKNCKIDLLDFRTSIILRIRLKLRKLFIKIKILKKLAKT